MDTNLPTTAQAPMIALIQTKNIMRTNNLKTKMKRTFAALLLFALLAPTAAWAQFSGGSGTEDDPYIIATTDDMDELASQVNNGNDYSGKFFLMTADLDFSGKTYTPVGNYNYGFKGTFNGNGHTISHVIIQSTLNFIGLFGWLESGGSINGLTLGEGSSIAGWNRVGGIVGQCGGAINGCNIVEGVTISANKTFVGGIVGDCVGGNVSNCQNRADVSSNTIACGGIVGIVSSGGEVLQCSNYGSVQASENCGGIVGRLVDCSMVTECINEGSISGDENVGGIVGFINEQSGNCFCSVSNCLNLGGVSASNSNYLGSISGDWSMGADFNNNYYAGECTIGHINGNDVAGEAMRGYTIAGNDSIVVSLPESASVGVAYENKVYAGENQEVTVSLSSSDPSVSLDCVSFSISTFTDNGDGTYTFIMPAEAINIGLSIVEMNGIYYQLHCDNGTATVVYDASYATLEWASIEDFEYQGTFYAVTAIANNAFDGCTELTGVSCHTPQLATIGANAFRNCTGIMSFGFYHTATPPAVGEGAFENVPWEDILLGVPYCSQYDYGQHEVFGQCGNVQGYELCEYNFMGFGGDGLWSNPANWMDANSEPCTNLAGEGAQVAIFAECEIDVDVTVESITNANYEEVLPLTVKTGVTLTATEYVYTSTTPGNLIIKDGAQVIHPNAGAQATVEKNITAYTPNSKNGWHLVSSPAIESFAPTADNGFLANEYDLYFYEESTHHWRNHKPNGQYANFNIEPLKGYLYANNQDVTLVFAGNLCAGNAMVNVPLYYSPTAGILKGFNLVGNPFAHNVTSFTGSNVAPEVYRMNGDGNDLMVGTIGTANPLLSGEGFFVKATGDDASITFNSRTNNAERSNITLEVSENGLIITLNENSTRIFATEGAQDWAVAVIASEAKQSSRTEQPINFKAAKNGTYTLTVNVENMDLDYLHLIDNMTGADVDLLTPPAFGHPLSEGEAQSGAELGSNSPATDSRTPAGVPPLQRGQGGFNYTFTAKTTDYASRFRLVFSSDDAGEDACEPPFAYINNGNIIINCTGTLQIIDILGKELVRKELSTFNSQLSTSNFAPGVYVLRLVGGDMVRTQKIVVEF